MKFSHLVVLLFLSLSTSSIAQNKVVEVSNEDAIAIWKDITIPLPSKAFLNLTPKDSGAVNPFNRWVGNEILEEDDWDINSLRAKTKKKFPAYVKYKDIYEEIMMTSLRWAYRMSELIESKNPVTHAKVHYSAKGKLEKIVFFGWPKERVYTITMNDEEMQKMLRKESPYEISWSDYFQELNENN